MKRLKQIPSKPTQSEETVSTSRLWSARRFSARQYGLVVIGLLVIAGGILLFASTGHVSQVYTGKYVGFSDIRGNQGTSDGGYSDIVNANANMWRNDLDISGSSLDTSSSMDSIINKSSSNHVVYLPIVNSYDDPTTTSTYASSNYANWATAVSAWCQKYCAGGTFWVGNTQGNETYAPRTIEMMNEPYGDWYRGNHQVPPADYAGIVKATRASLDGLSSKGITNIMLLSSAADNNKVSWSDTVNANGGYAGSGVAVSVHPYGPAIPDANVPSSPSKGWPMVNYFHNRYNKDEYITEDAWCTSGTCSDSGVLTESQRQTNIAAALNQLATQPWLKGFIYFGLYQGSSTYGLIPVGPGHTPTPSYTTFTNTASSIETSNPSEFGFGPLGTGGGSGDTTAPSVPTGLAAHTISSSEIDLSWTAASDNVGVTGYKIYRNGSSTALTTISGGATTYKDMSLSAGTSYSYIVTAVDAAGNESNKSSSVSATTSSGVNTTGYRVSGNQILDPNGKVFTAHGVDRPTLEWSCAGQAIDNSSNPIPASDYTTMKSTWGANIVRIALNEDYWLNVGGKCPNYKTTVQTQITNARAAGLLVILDLHWSDAGGQGSGSQWCMPDANSATFWTQVATTYKTQSDVWFELYNEPYPGNWTTWQNGGSVTCTNTPSSQGSKTFTSVGMQSLVNTVRATGAPNIVIAGGDHYASHLDGVPLLSDSAGNLAYAIHLYDGGGPESGYTSDYNTRFGNLAKSKVVIATEFGHPGGGACYNSNFMKDLLAYFDTNGIGYTGWAWYNGGCGFPSLIDNANGHALVSDDANVAQADMLRLSGQTVKTPSVPAGLASSNITSTSATISWTASTESGGSIAGYRVYRGTTLAGSPTGTSFNDAGLSAGTTYPYTVVAVDGAGTLSAASSPLSVTTAGAAGGGCTDGTTNGASVQNIKFNASTKTLTWSAFTNSNVTQYALATVTYDSSGARTGATYVHVTGTSATLAPLPGQTVNYNVDALDANGNRAVNNSGQTSCWGLEQPQPPYTWPAASDITPPSAPGNLTATATSTSQINLSWTASTDNVGVAGYYVYRNGGTTPIATIPASVTTFGDTGLNASTTYTYTVKAVDAAKNLSAAASAQATTQAVATTTTLTGVVSNTSSHAAISGATVRTGKRGTSTGAATTHTNSSGVYVLTGITANHSHSYGYNATGYASLSFTATYPVGTTTKNVALRPRSQ